MTEIHEEHQLEATTLERTLRAIEEALSRQEDFWFAGGADNYANRLLNYGLREDILQQLQEHGHEPYFARLDFEDARGAQSVYFGHAHLGRMDLQSGQILDWRCDLYSLFLGGNAPSQRYHVKATGQEHQVQLRLKRRLDIRARALERISDTVDYRVRKVPAGSGVATSDREVAGASDEFLIGKLRGRGDPHLQDIVATIQADQDAIIRAPLQTTLLLHGVAGSGKTSIAYHRLAYLMFTDHGYSLTAAQMLVIGPNRTFLGYVRGLLPSLGVTGIPQMTFTEWVQERLGKEIALGAVTITDAVADALDDRRCRPEDRARLWNSARLRGSLRFGELVERHAARLASRVPLPRQDLTLTLRNEEREADLHIAVADIHALWTAIAADLPLAARREQLISRAMQHVSGEYSRMLGNPKLPADVLALRGARRAIRDYLQASWKRPNLLDTFEEIFQPGHLPDIARGLFSGEEQRLLRATRPTTSGGRGISKQRVVDISDLAGLTVLSGRLYGSPGKTWRHLVVDEAQDFSPLQMQLLMAACPSGSVTLVGDTAQSIHAYRGVEDWNEFDSVLPQENLARHLITQNYRSTKELVAFGNALLRSLWGDRALLSSVIQRQGPRPGMTATADAAQHDEELLRTVYEFIADGHQSVAVIAPDTASVTATGRLLEHHGLAHRIITGDAELGPEDLRGVVVVPAALCKGLEFAAVIVPDASEARYPADDRHAGSLLYVAISRALHDLHLIAAGRFTAWLDDAQEEADVDYTRLPHAPLKWAGVTLMQQLRAARVGRVPFSALSADIERRVHLLLREGRGAEVHEAYTAFGQVSSLTMNDVLLQMGHGEPSAFVEIALAEGLPEALRDAVTDQLVHLEDNGHPQAHAYRQRFEVLLSGSPNLTGQMMPSVSRAVQATDPELPVSAPETITSPDHLRSLLGGDARPMRKDLRITLLRHIDDILGAVPAEVRPLVAAGIRFNVFNLTTAHAARQAYLDTLGQEL